MAKKILIVEDNDLNLKLFRDLLGANGYITFETKEGIEAISLTRNVMPDLIIMDIQLPEISGLDITRKIKADNAIRHIPIIAVTAFAMKDDEEKILAAGCEAYLSKPIAIDVFFFFFVSFAFSYGIVSFFYGKTHQIHYHSPNH